MNGRHWLFWGIVDMFWGIVDMFWGIVDIFWGIVDIFWGIVDTKKKARFGESQRKHKKNLCSQIRNQQIKYALPYFYFSEKREKREKLKKAESILENEKWTFINVQIMKS